MNHEETEQEPDDLDTIKIERYEDAGSGGLYRRGGRSKDIPKELSPYRDMPAKQGPDGPACHWCGDHKRLTEVGLCSWCVNDWVKDRRHRCVICAQYSIRPLKKGICVPCRGTADDIVGNLERMMKKLWLGSLR